MSKLTQSAFQGDDAGNDADLRRVTGAERQSADGRSGGRTMIRSIWLGGGQRVRRIYERLLLGRWESFLGLLALGGVVLIFLFATVHRRDLSVDLAKPYTYTAAESTRYPKLIQFWIEQGYLKHGGLWFLQPGDVGYIDEDHPRVYRSGAMGFLQVAHLLERINYTFRGKISYTLMVVHNQAWVWLSSAWLGVLGMRLSRRIGTPARYALLFGAASAVIYQTFPTNLWYYWELLPTGVIASLAILFLLIEEAGFDQERAPRWLTLARALCVFALVYAEPVSAILFLATYLLAADLLGSQALRRFSLLKTFLLPAGTALGVFALQLLFVRLSYPTVQMVGGGFMFRTGLDGSTQYYTGFLDLITSRFPFRFLPYLTPLTQWWFLFIAGNLAVLVLAGLYLRLLPELKCAILILAMAFGLYLPYVFLFSQAAVIHPYGYDVYLAIPLTLALFALLPASLERLTNNSGLFAFVAILLAFCYVMVQLRTYAMAFPLPNLPVGW